MSEKQAAKDEGPDPNTLPSARAPPSHPSIDPNAPGVMDGRSILEVDLNALAEKPWRRPGSDISDWFNYGFDEISWEAYCYRRREFGELANMLKSNVVVCRSVYPPTYPREDTVLIIHATEFLRHARRPTYRSSA